jgi:hypothetical protein
MVMMLESQYRYIVADESELDKLLSGREARSSLLVSGTSSLASLDIPDPGLTGVLWRSDSEAEGLAWPLALISHREDHRRLCGRYAQLRSDLSPLTAWCHLLSPSYFETLEGLVRTPHLEGFEAAWIGLVVAESLLLVERPISSVRISACLATQSFAIARTNALWRDISTEDILSRLDVTNRLLRSENAAQKSKSMSERIRTSFEPIWSALLECVYPNARANQSSLSAALRALRRARSSRDDQEAWRLAEHLQGLVPEAADFQQLPELAPELRLRIFDKLAEKLVKLSDVERSAASLLAGYLSTVAAGGSPSLTLAESYAGRFPEILAWAYVTGGVGEKVLWTSAFDGLGRLVARELLRPLRLDEAPTCDFALDEGIVLADSQLNDPLVNLRIKQARMVTVGLLPGVNVSVPLSEVASHSNSSARAETNKPTRSPEPSVRDSMSALADALWPYLKSHLDEYIKLAREAASNARGDDRAVKKLKGRKATSQPQLPLGSIKKS